MSNPIIEIPEEIKTTAERVVAGRECYMGTTVAMAEFVLGLNKPEIEVEPFVIYRVEVQGEDNYHIGFRVSQSAAFPWLTLTINYPEKENVYPVSIHNLGVRKDEEVKVVERWSPEAPELEFGIGEKHESVDRDREVLVKGVLGSETVDSDGDVLVQMEFSQGLTESHYVNAADIAYVGENNGN